MPRLSAPNTPTPIAAEGYRADILPAGQALALLVGIAKHQTSTRMAERAERFAADVAAARAASLQATAPVGGTMREQKEQTK
jgi:hypothetical protein